MKIEIKELNNKSRKGMYYYVKEKGHRGAYYKFHENVPLDTYTEYYRHIYIRKKKANIKEYKRVFTEKAKGKRVKGKTQERERINRYLRNVRKKGRLLGKIGKGIGTATINDIHNLTESNLKKAKESLFKRLVLDKELLDIITKDENIDKLTPRMSYFIEILGEDGKTLATGQKHNRGLRQIVNELKHAIKKGEAVTDGYASVIRRLKNLEWQGLLVKKEGHVSKCRLRIEFAKSR